ncbi:hypothetical protein A2_00040 [Pseudomonas phage BIM BV-45]|nr:hypothetical protein A2_00040 [Pseudomonas phage BIM BV-45]
MIATSAMLMANAAHMASRSGGESTPMTPDQQAAMLIVLVVSLVVGAGVGIRYGDPWIGDAWFIGFIGFVVCFLLGLLGVAIWV